MRRVLIMLVCGCAAKAPTGAVAVVNGRVLTEGDLAQAARPRSPGAPAPERAAVVSALVDEELAAQQAERMGLQPDDAARRELERLDAARAQVRRRALANAWLAKAAADAAQVSDSEARAYWAAHGAELSQEVRVAMALRRSPAELDPKLLSETGWLSYAQVPAAWRPVLDTLAVGETSGVIAGSGERYWRVRLLERREGPLLTFEAARPLIASLIADERVRVARSGASTALRRTAHVELFSPPRGTP